MKKVLLTLLAVIVVLGALASAGLVGYRIGYNRAALSDGNAPLFMHPERMNPNTMPGLRRDSGLWNQPYHSPMIGRGDFGFSMFYPLRFLWNIAILALVIWFAYWLFTKSGWRITRQAVKEEETPPANPEG